MGCSHDTLALERTTLTAARTAKTGHAKVEMKHRAVACGELIRMVGGEEFHLCVRDGCCRHHAGGYEDRSLVAVGECRPAYLLAVGVALRAGVVSHHIFHFAAVAAYELTGETVIVVLLRTTTVICELAELVGNFHYVAEAGKDQRCIVG